MFVLYIYIVTDSCNIPLSRHIYIILFEVAIGPAVYSCPVSDLGVRASTEWVRLGLG